MRRRIVIGSLVVVALLLGLALGQSLVTTKAQQQEDGVQITATDVCLVAGTNRLCIDKTTGFIGNMEDQVVPLHFRYNRSDFAEMAICNAATHLEGQQDQACAIMGVGGPNANPASGITNAAYFVSGAGGPRRVIYRSGIDGGWVEIGAGGEQPEDVRLWITESGVEYSR